MPMKRMHGYIIKCVENALLGQAVCVYKSFFFLLHFFIFSFIFLFFFLFSLSSVNMKLPAETVELGQQEVHTNSFGGSFIGLLLITHLSSYLRAILTLCLHKTMFIALKNPPVLCLLWTVLVSAQWTCVHARAHTHTHTHTHTCAHAHTHTHTHKHTHTCTCTHNTHTLQQKM